MEEPVTQLQQVRTEIRGSKRSQILRKIRGRYNINLTGFLYILPVIVLIGFFLIYPILQVIYYSFFNWDGVNASFVGMTNYLHLFHSSIFGRIALNNLILLLSIPLWVLVPLILAIFLHKEVKGWKVFRFILFAPTALSWAVVGIVWQFIFSYRGPMNDVFKLFGIHSMDWMQGSGTAMAAVIITTIWAYLGTGLIIYLAGLSTISPEIVEAAIIDGASGWSILWRIIIPLMKRYIEFFSILCIIAAFTGMFSLIFVMTSGGPGFATTTMEYYIYVDAFTNMNYGEASAVGMLLFLMVFMISLIQIKFFKSDD